MKLCISAFLLLGSLSVFADTITIKADQWCPYNCDPKSDKPGYIIEAAKIIFEKAGHKLDYQTMAWPRALQDAKDGNITGVVGANAEEVKEGFVLPKVPQGLNAFSFFVKKGSSWKYTGPDSLKQLKYLGVIADYSYNDEINAFIKANKPLIDLAAGETPLDQCMKKLDAGRITAVVEDRNVFNLAAANSSFKDSFEDAGTSAEKIKLYMAFSSKNPKAKEYASILEKGWTDMRKSGELKKILDKYNAKDWE